MVQIGERLGSKPTKSCAAASEADADTAHGDDIGPLVDRSVTGLAREVGHMADGGCDGLTLCRPHKTGCVALGKLPQSQSD